MRTRSHNIVNLQLTVFAQEAVNMRQQTALYYVVFVVLLIIVVITLQWKTTIYRDYNEEVRRKLLSLAEAPSTSSSPAIIAERTNIFFLKAHKCASSTLQNILMRFGYARDLLFVLPMKDNYIGSPKAFNADMINQSLASLDGKYNLFTHHTRYNAEQVKAVMYDDTTFVTILRDPADVFESIFSYYKLNKFFYVSLKELLETPSKISQINRRYLSRIGLNQMSFDLGFLEEDFNSEEKIQEFVNKIDNEFDLVMISEYMEASLVLLSDLLHWPLESVVSLKLNSRPDGIKYSLNDTDRKLLSGFNHVDSMLYKHFLYKFHDRIREYGEEKMKENILKLLTLNEKFSYRCVEGMNTKGYAHTTSYKLRSSPDWLCFYAARPELAFTDELRTYQIKKLKVLNKLNKFMNNAADNS